MRSKKYFRVVLNEPELRKENDEIRDYMFFIDSIVRYGRISAEEIDNMFYVRTLNHLDIDAMIEKTNSSDRYGSDFRVEKKKGVISRVRDDDDDDTYSTRDYVRYLVNKALRKEAAERLRRTYEIIAEKDLPIDEDDIDEEHFATLTAKKFMFYADDDIEKIKNETNIGDAPLSAYLIFDL